MKPLLLVVDDGESLRLELGSHLQLEKDSNAPGRPSNFRAICACRVYVAKGRT